MAARGSDPEPILQGYDAVFDPELDRKYICPVCLAALRDPVQTKCGHRFCRVCLKHSRGKSLYGKCPVDKNWFDPARQVFEDIAVKREVLSLTIRCDNHTEGCKWRGELRDRESHAGKCPNGTVTCSNSCGHACTRANMPMHLEQCPRRLEPCQKCGRRMQVSELAKHQLLVCEKFPVTCSVCGDTDILRENVARHVDVTEGDCPLVIVKCQFEHIGCYFQDKRKNMASHHQSANLHHMQLLMMTTKEQQCLINNQQSQLTELAEQCHQLGIAKQEQQSIVAEQGNVIQLQAACITELEIDNNTNGRLLWRLRVPENGNKTITSQTFHTHQHGYKVSLSLELRNSNRTISLYVNQDASANNKHPFDGICHVTIFDQSGQRDDYKNTFPCWFRGDYQESSSVLKKSCLDGFMASEQLFSWPFTKDNAILLYVAIKPKLSSV